jgi:hypothetical protein
MITENSTFSQTVQVEVDTFKWKLSSLVTNWIYTEQALNDALSAIEAAWRKNTQVQRDSAVSNTLRTLNNIISVFDDCVP